MVKVGTWSISNSNDTNLDIIAGGFPTNIVFQAMKYLESQHDDNLIWSWKSEKIESPYGD